MTDRIRLGTVLAPSGVLVVIDPGCAALWAHTEQDFDRDEGWSFDEDAPERAKSTVDIRISGPDAAEAGRRFNRQWHHLWLFDIPKAEAAALELSFQDVVAAHGLDAELEICGRRIPHRERVDYAVEQGGGSGEIHVHGVMNVVCAGVPTNRELAVFAEFMPEGDNETRWRRIYLEVEPGREIASSERIGRTGVDYARLMFVDADALGAWGSGESLASAAEKQDFGIATACWPHSNHWKLMREVWRSPHESASIDLGASRLCGFMTSWGDTSRGDAIFDVFAERDADGGLVRLTIDCGSEIMENRQLEDRWFGELSKCAIVTKNVMSEGKPVAYLFREDSVGETDSGWVVTGGENCDYLDDTENVVLVRLSEVVRLHPDVEQLLESPKGTAFRRSEAGQGFVPVAFPDPLGE